MLVLKYHLNSDYVLDKMEFYEVNALMKYEYYAHKDAWEQARLIAYMVAQVNTKKELKFSDITQFYWEQDSKGDTSIKKADIERLKNKAQQYLDRQNGRSSN